MAKQGSFQYVPLFSPEFNPVKDRKKLDPPRWKNFDRQGKEVVIKKKAERDADFGDPSGENWSDTENEIRADANNYQNDLVKIGKEYFQKLDKIISSYRHFLDLDNFETFYNDLTINARNCIDRAKLELSRLQRVHKENVKHYERFQKMNLLKRMPFLISKWKAFGIVSALFVIEVLINNFLVAGHLEGGGLEAIALTAGIAFLNVFFSLGIGYYLLKNIVHTNTYRRIIGAFVLVLHITLFFYINWMYSAFRTQKVMEFTEGLDTASILENISVWLPWTVDMQFESLILLFIGFVFAVAALVDGYFFDDPYPGYGKMAHTYNKSKKDIEAELDNLVSTMQEIFKGVQKESQNMRTTLTLAVSAWSEETNSFQNEFDSYEKKILNAEKDINYLLEQYIIVNKQRRDKTKYPLPKRFEETRPFSYSDDLKNPHEVFRAHKHVYREDGEREKERKEFQSEVNEDFNIFTKQVEEFREEMLITIKEIQKEYEPA